MVGGGIIGLEMASVYDALGSQVTVVELLAELLAGCDRDLVRPLEKRIASRYHAIRLGTRITSVEPQRRGIKVWYGDESRIYDRVLVAVGRVPCEVDAGAAGVAVDERGFIPVDETQRTNVPYIFAVGDITGPPLLAHRATHQGKVAAEVAAGRKAAFEASVIPSVAYTDPEIAWVGVTETQAKAESRAIEKATFPWAASGRAIGTGRDEGPDQAHLRRREPAPCRSRHRRPARRRAHLRGRARHRDGSGPGGHRPQHPPPPDPLRDRQLRGRDGRRHHHRPLPPSPQVVPAAGSPNEHAARDPSVSPAQRRIAFPSSMLNATTTTYLGLIGNGKRYRVQPYQQDYSWTEEEWEDLWNDVVDLHREPDSRHYMGAVVVEAESDREFLVIDGQQRLATIGIFTLAVIRKLRRMAERGIDPERNLERAQELRNRFIGEKDPASLVESSRLNLNETDDAFYQDYLVQLREPHNPRGLHRSGALLWKCFGYFSDRLEELADVRDDGEALTRVLSETIARRLLFISITVDDDFNAYTVFETLNARGLELTTTDLLKNYLFSKVTATGDLDVLKRRWQSLVATVTPQRFSDFLRYHLLCERPNIRKQWLFKLVA